MKKKHNITSHLLAACCLATLLASGCTADDPFHSAPQGAIPLRLGSVSIGGAETATRAAATRAEVTTENAAGYTGLRKTRFVDGNELILTLSDANGSNSRRLTATRSANSWQLSGQGAEKVFIIPGTTTITATHKSEAVIGGTESDDLIATTYTLDGQSISLSMTHANALIDITLDKSVPENSLVAIHASNGSSEATVYTNIETYADGNHYTAILSKYSLTKISVKINGVTYIAPLDPALTLEANKRYPIALSFKQNKLTATVGTASLDWKTGGEADLLPVGYTYYIGTPEDLAQFAADLNASDKNDPIRKAIVMQTADIDLSQLKTASAAGKNYTYTATPDDWVPIGDFAGSFNGNGHVISNMKITNWPTGQTRVGFFSDINGAKLTGIHLRDAQVKVTPPAQGKYNSLGVLVGSSASAIISLCSVTGSVTADDGGNLYALGGLGGSTNYGVHISRCSINVDVTGNATNVGGFMGELYTYNCIAACSYTGTVTSNAGQNVGGFAGKANDANLIGCSADGTLSGTTVTKYAFAAGMDLNIKSCYSSMNVGASDFGPNDSGYTACAYTGSTAISGVTGDQTPGGLYAILTTPPNLSMGKSMNTLHWSKADGYTTNEVSKDWYAAGIWQDNAGAAPTMDLTYEGGLRLPGYNYYIDTPEDLARFAAALNASSSGDAIRTAKVLQTADIDLSTLAPSGDYAATAENWVPMQNFAGSYNGYGHTISNMKITSRGSTLHVGFMGYVSDAKITGVHLRNATINIPGASTNKNVYYGLLCGQFSTSTITLCSVTGSININNSVSSAKFAGGMLGYVAAGIVSRCSANVDINIAADVIGGLTGGHYGGNSYAACSYYGNITSTGNSKIGGLVGDIYEGTIIGCSSGGSISGSSTDRYAFCGGSGVGNDVNMKSCYSTMTGSFQGFGYEQIGTYTDCAMTGTQAQPSTITGVTAGVEPVALYSTITKTADLSMGKSDMTTLHWSQDDGYTLKVVTGDWKAKGIWQDNGTSAPTIDLTYEGEGSVAP